MIVLFTDFGADDIYVGQVKGLLSVAAARAAKTQTRRIVWRPPNLSSSFHGRDLFAPVAAWIVRGDLPSDAIEETGELLVRLGPDDLSEVIYTDHYGNALTGLRAHNVPRSAVTAPPMPAFLPKRRLAAPSGTKTVSAW